MNSATPLTIQSLATIQDAVRDALKAAGQALASGSGDAQRHWQSAHAALQVVNHVGLVKLSGELGALIAAADGDFKADRAASFAAGSDALIAYIAAVTAGRRDQPLRLWPAYEALQRARGVAQPSASDLFFPNLNVGPGERADAAALTSDELRNTRRQYETGLLQWLRKSDAAGLQQIGDAVTRVEAAQAAAHARRLWWVARAVLDALLHDGLAVDALSRRVVTQLNLHLGRMVQGPAETPEPLLRDALFLAASAKPVTPHIEAVQRECGLVGALDLEAPTPDGFSAQALAAARIRTEGLQELWSACAADASRHAEFEPRARALAGACEPLGDPALTALVTQLADTSGQLAKAGAAPHEAATLEGACALLLIERVLQADHAPDAGFADRARNMAARLAASVQAPQTLSALPPAQLLDESAQQAEAAQHEAQVHAEIARDLRDSKTVLESWFSDTTKLDAISMLDKPLRRVAGAFSVLGHGDAARLSEQCRADVARYAQGTPCGEADGQLLTRLVTVLSTFVDELKHGPVAFADVAKRLAISIYAPAEPAAPEPPPAPAPLIEAMPALQTLPVIEVPPPAQVVPAAAAAAPVAVPAAAPVDAQGDTDPEMFDIFVEEATEVLQTIADTTPQSRAQPQNQELLTNLRRAFHTLKGSGRMVGLKNLGEAAWEMEQVFNERSQQQLPGTPDVYRLVDTAHGVFTRWVGELRSQKSAAIDAAQLTEWARKLRAGEALPAEAVAVPPPAQVPAAEPAVVEAVVEPPKPALPDTVQIGEVKVSRTLYDIMLPEARQTVVVLQAENGTLQDDGKVTPAFVRAAHTLSGISGTAGFPAMRTLGLALERVLETAAEAGATLKPEARALTARAVAALAQQVADLQAQQAPAEHAALVAALDAVTIQREVPAAPAVAPIEVPVPRVPAPVLAPLVAETPVAVAPAPVTPPPSAPAPAAPTPVAPVRPVLPSTPEAPDGERRRYRLNDDIDAQLLPIFLEEAAELVPQVGQDLRAWRARPEDKLVAQSLKRLLHTLKGSARMAGAMALGQLTHSMESRIENAQRLPTIPEQLIDELETSFDRIGTLITQLQEREPAAGTAASAAVPLPQAMEQMSRTMQLATASGAMTQLIPMPYGADGEGAGGPVSGLPRPMIRVRADLIDRLANQAGEVSIARARVSAELRSARGSLRELTENVSRLRAQLRELEIAAETQMQSRFASGPEQAGGKFDPLEFDRFTRLQELTRLMAESVNDVATVQHSLARDLDEGEKALASQAQTTRDVQQDLMAIRMVPFASISDRLYRVTRLSAKDSEKRVGLDIVGEQVEVDRGVMDRIAAPIEHLLRNAIVHGIEAPAQRAAAGKPEAGSLKLEVRQEGNEVVLTLADDGAGLNIVRIREKAISLGMMREDEELSDQQIGNFIFRSGFSTANAVTAEAGRGVGMDVVMSEVTALGGRVNTQFERGQGTTFTIHLPLTLSVLQAVVMRLGGAYFAVPTMMVEQVQRLKSEVLAAANAAREIEWQGAVYPFHQLAKLLEAEMSEETPQYGSVILLRSGSNRAAIQVDDIVGGQEIVIKNIGPQLARVPGITGAAVLGSGETVLIINPVLLTGLYLEAATQARELKPAVVEALPPAAPAEPERPRNVLVVDDSLTVRKITDRLLTREGYRVVVAKDGVEALEKIHDQMPDVMITDVEMPRMDGFDLAKNVRADESLKALPIIMITSRTAEKHRQHAAELGVDVFLGKPYEESELLGHIATLSRRAITA